MSNTLIKKFEEKFIPEPNSGCWLWTAGLNYAGYAAFWDGMSTVRAHRWAYECYKGLIPEELQLDHLCRVRSCVNPDHLEPVTQRENTLRGIRFNAEKTHCKHGHPFDQINTYICPDGKRQCRICNKLRSRQQYRKKLQKIGE